MRPFGQQTEPAGSNPGDWRSRVRAEGLGAGFLETCTPGSEEGKTGRPVYLFHSLAVSPSDHPIVLRFSFVIPKTRPYNHFFFLPPRSLDMRESGRRAVAWRPTPHRQLASIRRRDVQASGRSWVSEAVRPSRTAFKHLHVGSRITEPLLLKSCQDFVEATIR
jgi:hypothetical protein